mmetsp:Transcript_38125/g.96425  ORF Transcript_38125/g.96425 Transcript_38125/m.96425 type:complete len:371 (-) Transcript_38125:560-1672(-)
MHLTAPMTKTVTQQPYPQAPLASAVAAAAGGARCTAACMACGLIMVLALVPLVKCLDGDAAQQLAGEDAQQGPRQVQGPKDGAVLVRALRHKLALKLVQELEVQQVLGRQRLLTHHGLHGGHVLANGVVGVHLVGHLRVVLARHALADGRLHQAGQGGQHVDGGVDLAVVQLAVNVDLALRDVAREIGDGVRDVVVGHGENGQLRDGALAALDTAGALVDGGQIRVHVAGVAAAAGHLLTGGRHLTQRVGVRGHVGQDDQHVVPAVVRQVLGGGERNAGRDDALNGGVVGQVQEQHGALQGAVLLEVLLEEVRSLHVHTHGSEHNGELVALALSLGTVTVLGGLARQGAVHQAGLTANLGGNVVVGQTCS